MRGNNKQTLIKELNNGWDLIFRCDCGKETSYQRDWSIGRGWAIRRISKKPCSECSQYCKECDKWRCNRYFQGNSCEFPKHNLNWKETKQKHPQKSEKITKLLNEWSCCYCKERIKWEDLTGFSFLGKHRGGKQCEGYEPFCLQYEKATEENKCKNSIHDCDPYHDCPKCYDYSKPIGIICARCWMDEIMLRLFARGHSFSGYLDLRSFLET